MSLVLAATVIALTIVALLGRSAHRIYQRDMQANAARRRQ